MKTNYMEVLSREEIETIHNYTLELLESLGVRFETEESRKLLENHGAEIEIRDGLNFVKIPESLVKETLKKVPETFSLTGWDGSYSFNVDTKTTQYATVGTPVTIYDPEKKKKVRRTKLADTISQIRIVDSLKNVVCSHVDVWPNDVKYTEMHYHTIKAWAENSRKPYGLGCLGRVASLDMMNLLSILVGGEEELKKNPRLIGFMNPTSPLLQTNLMLNGMFIFCEYGQPLIIAPAASAGSTAPVTLAGLLVQTNMEVLSGIVLSQLINSGTPVFYSTMNAPMDPSTGNVAWGSIETGLISVGAAQLARFYKIPSRGPGAVTDSKVLDLQNGYERFMTLFCSAKAGINYITCAGTYEAGLAEALELLVIDDELIDIVNRGLEGIVVDETTLAIDEIKEVAGKGKNYLGRLHSVKNTRKELIIPKLMNRERRGRWYKDGAKDLIQVAREKVDQILETQEGPNLSPKLESELEEYYKIIASRTMADFEKGEGIKADNGNINDLN